MPDFKEYNDRDFDFKDDKKDDKKEDKKDKKGIKKFIKSPWFLAGLLFVVFLVIYNKIKQSGSSESVEIPLGYSGYPDGGSTSYYDDALETMSNEMNSALEDIYKESETNLKLLENEFNYQNKIYENTIDEMSQQLDSVWKGYDEMSETVDKQSEMIEYQNILSQMQANSDKALLTNSQSEKDYLHTLNLQLADVIGAKFNDNDGYYYIDGQRIYSTALQSDYAQKTTSSSPSTSSGSSSSVISSIGMTYEQALAKMEQNSKDYHVSNDTDKQALYKENQELGKSIGLTYDDTTGKWKKADGSDAWDYNQNIYKSSGSSSSSTKKTTSSSSGSGVKTTVQSSSVKETTNKSSSGVTSGTTTTTTTTNKTSSSDLYYSDGRPTWMYNSDGSLK